MTQRKSKNETPPPLAGGGRGRGLAPAGANESVDEDLLARVRAQTPPPTPSRKGRGGATREQRAPAVGTDAAPLSSAEFDRLMQAVGPFESQPRIAVAVSGGGDSMALTLLAAGWSKRRGGEIVAITVDHGLRAEAAAEARQVGRWLKQYGIAHRVLRWDPPAALTGGVQAAARDARYRLLADWCRRHRFLHLALAHHREDQAETFLLRLARGSGLDGLAAMDPIAERDGVRLIRPLLPVARARLRAMLTAAGQAWIDDPSNENPAHARVRMRRLMPALAEDGLDAARLAGTATHLGRARAALDDQVAALLATAAAVFPAGYVRLDLDLLQSAASEVALRALAHCLVTVGGAGYAPRLDRLERLHRAIREGRLGGGVTLAGCRVLPRRGMLLVCREPAMATEEVALDPGAAVLWDGRFQIRLTARKAGWKAPLVLRRLGADGWATLTARDATLRRHPIPPPVRPSLPAVWAPTGLVAVPHLDICLGNRHINATALFLPRAPLARTRFTVA
jgi:tRNA(Ile)-lysidine synthase